MDTLSSVNGLTDYDAKGEARKVYLAWFGSGAGSTFFSQLPVAPTLGETLRYDAFGRQLDKSYLDGTTALHNVYHALSQDTWDAADLALGPRYGTYASARKDGHGRSLETIERVHVGSTIEERKTLMTYLPSGEAQTLTRQRGADVVTRWMRYDSLGRMVLNVDPHTTVGFKADPSTAPATLKAWRYAYNDNGDLVGTSDARGCGENFAYDTAGRLLTEDYSPCLDTQADYTSGPEVTNRFDFPDSDTANGFTIDGGLLRGHLVSVSDRAQKTLTRFDGRGRVTGIARRVAAPGAPGIYAPRWYTQTATFDGADRPIDQTTGASVTELLGQGGQSFVTTDYTKRGTVKSVGGSYGALVTGVLHDADGLPSRIEYGDLAHTTTDFGHDNRRRLQTVQTYRGPPVEWSTPPASYSPAPNLSGPDKVFQSILEDGEYVYDEVDNPVEIRDNRNPAVWPAGAKPVNKTATYDDLYRLTRLQYQYAAGDDTWTDPFDAETQGQHPDTRRAQPSPHVAFDKRVLEQTYAYDWLGNLTTSGDDAHGFYDRSLGTQSHSGTNKPYQLTSASGAVSTRDGSLTLAYDPTGNTTSMALVRNGACLPSTAQCSQRFAYDWDEVGRLSRARRWDLSSPGVASDLLPSGTPAVDLRYAYDATDARVLKTAVDASANEVHTVYLFASLEVRRAVFQNGDYDDTRSTEVAYLFAHGVRLARLHYSDDSLPTLTSGKLHVLLALPDHLGSSSIVVDKESGELVERSTYQAYGGADSDYRPDRWGSFREDYRFTGKEEDSEVGLAYFGHRYLAVGLDRWLSADPLAVHSPASADANLYAYVRGSVLKSIDPVGLDAATAAMGFAEGFGKAFGAAVFVGTSVLLAPEVGTAAAVVGVALLVGSVVSLATDGTPAAVKRVIDGKGTDEDDRVVGGLFGGVAGCVVGGIAVRGAMRSSGGKGSSTSVATAGESRAAASEVGQTGQSAVASKPPAPATHPPPPAPLVAKPAAITTSGALEAAKTEQYLQSSTVAVKQVAATPSDPVAMLRGVEGRAAAKGPLTFLDEVVAHVAENGKLPDNFIIKKDAAALGWKPRAGNLADVAPGKSLGGDVFENRDGVLPSAPGRTWFEADLNYTSGFRGSDRLLYSTDGLMFVSTDHYKTFSQIK